MQKRTSSAGCPRSGSIWSSSHSGSHTLQSQRFDAFWELVRSSLAPDGQVWFVDNLSNSYPRMEREPPVDGVVTRHLRDGRTFRIVKHYHDPSALADGLAGLGWRAHVDAIGRYFLVGEARRGGTA